MGETPAGRRCIATKNLYILYYLLPLASCLLPFPKQLGSQLKWKFYS
ncbi:hypothetical protein [Moorena sp. SIO4G3]|nr:hypothetical protein [Moorena sp. SIO4G3]NEO77297.1 hypothetical protein [Moorena sp. SIO4G3]